MTFFQNPNRKSAARTTTSTRRRRRRPRVDILCESLESRTLLANPTVSINSVTITLNTPGPTSVSAALNPGNELAAYRIDGTAGEQLQFHSVSDVLNQRELGPSG